MFSSEFQLSWRHFGWGAGVAALSTLRLHGQGAAARVTLWTPPIKPYRR